MKLSEQLQQSQDCGDSVDALKEAETIRNALPILTDSLKGMKDGDDWVSLGKAEDILKEWDRARIKPKA